MGEQIKTIRNAITKFVEVCDDIVTNAKDSSPSTKSRLGWYKKCLERTYELDPRKVKTQHLALFGDLVKKIETNLLGFNKGADDGWLVNGKYEIVFGANTGNPTSKIAIEISTIYRLAKATGSDLQEDYLYAFFNVLCWVSGLTDKLDVHLNSLVVEYAPPDPDPEPKDSGPQPSSTDTAGRLMEGADQLSSVISNPEVMRQVTSLIQGIFDNPQLRSLAQNVQGQLGQGNPAAPLPGPPPQLTLVDEDAEIEEKQ